MANLQKQRTIAERPAANNALTTANAQRLIDMVFKIGVFNKGATNSTGRAQLVFGGGGEFLRLGDEITGAQIAIAAHGIFVNAFYG